MTPAELLAWAERMEAIARVKQSDSDLDGSAPSWVKIMLANEVNNYRLAARLARFAADRGGWRSVAMKNKTDLDALDQLRGQFERNVRPYDYTTALHHAYPALAAELREARKEIAELRQGIESANGAAAHYLSKITEAQKGLDARDRRMKALGAAEELDQLREHILEYVGPDDARDDISRICFYRAADLKAAAGEGGE